MTQGFFSQKFNTKGFYKILSLSLMIFFALIACSPSENQIEFSAPFELRVFLKNHIHKLPGQPVQFQILSLKDEPIPYGLLKFQWVEGGRMSFQADQDGILNMQFERDILDYEVIVSPEIADAKLRVMW